MYYGAINKVVVLVTKSQTTNQHVVVLPIEDEGKAMVAVEEEVIIVEWQEEAHNRTTNQKGLTNVNIVLGGTYEAPEAQGRESMCVGRQRRIGVGKKPRIEDRSRKNRKQSQKKTRAECSLVCSVSKHQKPKLLR